MEYRFSKDPLFGKYCYIDTPWIAGKNTIYRIVNSGVRSNAWVEVPISGRAEVVLHDYQEDVVFVVLDTLISEDSRIKKVALKDVEIADTPQTEPSEEEIREAIIDGCKRSAKFSKVISTSQTEQTDCDTCRHYKLACELFSEVCKYEPTTQNSNLTFETDTPQTEKDKVVCPNCGRSDYIRSFEKDFSIKNSEYKYKCINCNTYIKDTPHTESTGSPIGDYRDGVGSWQTDCGWK